MGFVRLTTVDPKTGITGHDIHVNPRRVVKLVQENIAKDTPDAQPKWVTTLTFASGDKKETVEGRMLDVAKSLDQGARG